MRARLTFRFFLARYDDVVAVARGDVRVEVTSVNGKGLKVETDVPSSIQRFKPALDTYIRSRLSRGTVRARIRIIPAESNENVWKLDEECLKRYRKDLFLTNSL